MIKKIMGLISNKARYMPITAAIHRHQTGIFHQIFEIALAIFQKYKIQERRGASC
jgi:hypothetical protein